MRVILVVLVNQRKAICKGITVLTQLYCQIHTIYQLHVSTFMAIVRLDKVSDEKTTQYNMVQYKY